MKLGTEPPQPLLFATMFLAALVSSAVLCAASIEDARSRIDASGSPTDTAKSFDIEGVVVARATLPDGSALAIVHDGSALPVLLDKAAAAEVRARDAVKLTGRLREGPFGFAALAADASSIRITGTNQSKAVDPHGAAEFVDASAFATNYLVVTNVTFDLAEPKFTSGRFAVAKDASGKAVKVYVGRALEGREKPSKPVNIFGAADKFQGEGWTLVPARFVPANASALRALATKHTCITCHSPDTKLLGPSYRDVAAKLKDDPKAIATIIKQIEDGGAGKWGQVPMLPFKGRIPPADMDTLAHWIHEMRWDTVLGE